MVPSHSSPSSQPPKTDIPLYTHPVELIGEAKSYAWGKVGQDSRIAAFLSDFGPGTPLAEYWLGTHPKGGSTVQLPREGKLLLSAWIHRAPMEILGAECVRRFGSDLPFMVKVLSINPEFGLSIQLHPDRTHAAQLNAQHPELYPDASHKPEVGIALTPVTLLYGFRSIQEISGIFRKIPALYDVLLPDTAARLKTIGKESGDTHELLRRLYSEILTAAPSVMAECVSRVLNQLHAVSDAEREIFVRLERRYGPSDPGLLALFVMNIIQCEPGKALFIPANAPHAYLDGDLVECMACSDNVVRAGLTSKPRDIETLLALVDFSSSLPPAVPSTVRENGFQEFETPAEEFRVSTLAPNTVPYHVTATGLPQLLFSLDGQARVQCGEFNRMLLDGHALFVPAKVAEYVIQVLSGQVFHVTVGKIVQE